MKKQILLFSILILSNCNNQSAGVDVVKLIANEMNSKLPKQAGDFVMKSTKAKGQSLITTFIANKGAENIFDDTKTRNKIRNRVCKDPNWKQLLKLDINTIIIWKAQSGKTLDKISVKTDC